MVPATFQVLEGLPRTANGKVDRQGLAARETAPPETPAGDGTPHNEVERRLLAIWKDVLKSASDNVNQDFFELGGHSLLAAKLLMRIEKEFGVSLTLAFIFQSPTVAQMAEGLRG